MFEAAEPIDTSVECEHKIPVTSAPCVECLIPVPERVTEGSLEDVKVGAATPAIFVTAPTNAAAQKFLEAVNRTRQRTIYSDAGLPNNLIGVRPEVEVEDPDDQC